MKASEEVFLFLVTLKSLLLRFCSPSTLQVKHPGVAQFHWNLHFTTSNIAKRPVSSYFSVHFQNNYCPTLFLGGGILNIINNYYKKVKQRFSIKKVFFKKNLLKVYKKNKNSDVLILNQIMSIWLTISNCLLLNC